MSFLIFFTDLVQRTKPNGSSGVEIHLAGAARLIALSSINSTTNDNSQISNAEGAMHRLARESFIFHVATSLPFQQSDAYRVEIETALSLAEQAISQHFRPNLLLHPDSPVLGFPPELFRCVYTVYRLYQSSSCQEVSLETRQTLDRDLQEWDQRIKARCQMPAKEEEASPKSPADNEGFQIMSVPSSTEREPNYWWMGPKLYTLGCRLLLRRMEGPDQAQLAPTVDQLLPEGVDALRKLQPDQDYYADYYCWPLFAIGMHLQSAPDRQLLLRQVWAFWEATNNGTMRRLADMLEFFWK